MAYRILIVEDDDFLRSLAVTKLQAEGFAMEIAATGDEGVSKIMALPPDLVILDLMLPNVSGFDILQKIRENEATKKLKVIVFSNLGEEADIKKCLDLGVSEYLVKANFTLDELAEKIKLILGT
jgi:DNA-binding response OmpR family regulator